MRTSKDIFLNIAKTIQKNINNLNNDKEKIKLSVIQEWISKAIGKSNFDHALKSLHSKNKTTIWDEIIFSNKDQFIQDVYSFFSNKSIKKLNDNDFLFFKQENSTFPSFINKELNLFLENNNMRSLKFLSIISLLFLLNNKFVHADTIKLSHYFRKLFFSSLLDEKDFTILLKYKAEGIGLSYDKMKKIENIEEFKEIIKFLREYFLNEKINLHPYSFAFIDDELSLKNTLINHVINFVPTTSSNIVEQEARIVFKKLNSKYLCLHFDEYTSIKKTIIEDNFNDIGDVLILKNQNDKLFFTENYTEGTHSIQYFSNSPISNYILNTFIPSGKGKDFISFPESGLCFFIEKFHGFIKLQLMSKNDN